MKELNLKLVLPYNWAHARSIKVYDDNKKLLTKIRHCEFKQLEVPDTVSKLVVKLDFHRSEIELPMELDKYYVILYFDFRDTFFMKYIDSLKKKLLAGRVVEQREFELFWVDFYTKSSPLTKPAVLNRPNLILGMIISAAIVIISVVEQRNPFVELLFLLGVGSLFSLIMILAEKGRIQQFDYRARTIATGGAFFLAICFMESTFSIKLLLMVFSLVFLLRSIPILRLG